MEKNYGQTGPEVVVFPFWGEVEGEIEAVRKEKIEMRMEGETGMDYKVVIWVKILRGDSVFVQRICCGLVTIHPDVLSGMRFRVSGAAVSDGAVRDSGV